MSFSNLPQEENNSKVYTFNHQSMSDITTKDVILEFKKLFDTLKTSSIIDIRSNISSSCDLYHNFRTNKEFDNLRNHAIKIQTGLIGLAINNNQQIQKDIFNFITKFSEEIEIINRNFVIHTYKEPSDNLQNECKIILSLIEDGDFNVFELLEFIWMLYTKNSNTPPLDFEHFKSEIQNFTIEFLTLGDNTKKLFDNTE